MATTQVPLATPAPVHPPEPRGIDQVYVTHCSPGDSFADTAGYSYGFGVRASSTENADLLNFALELGSYELPADMRYKKVEPKNAPRRLAWLRLPGGFDALVHSTHLTYDTSDPPRLGSYFSHILFTPRLTLRQAIESWAAPGWAVSYPRGANKKLPVLRAVPSRGPINEATLSAFLANGPAPAETSLDVVVWPARLNDFEARRKLVRRVLKWVSLYRATGQGAGRLTMSAEPGLTALLLFAVARLLPPSYSEGLTFSTYETGDSSKDDRLAKLVVNGAYGRPAQAGAAGGRMLMLDTFAPIDRAVPELDAAGAAFDPLITLAARGGTAGWEGVSRIHEFMGKSARPLSEVLVEIDGVAPSLEAVEQGTAKLGDLLKVIRSEVGRAYLKSPSLQPRLWSQVFSHHRNPELAKLYTELFREPAHLAEFRAYLRRVLGKAGAPDWSEEWSSYLLHFTGRDEPATQVRELIRESAESGEKDGFDPAARLALLSAWRIAEPAMAKIPADCHWLLPVGTPAEFETLVQAKFPESWLALSAAISTPAVAAAALQRGNDALAALSSALSARPEVAEFLAQAVQPTGPGTAPPAWFTRFLVRPDFRPGPEAVDGLLTRLRAEDESWDSFWTSQNALALVLEKLPPSPGKFAERLFKRLCDQLTPADLAAGPGQSARLSALSAGRKALAPRAPAAVAVLDAAELLANHLSGRTVAQPATPDALRAACSAVSPPSSPIPANWLFDAVFERYVPVPPPARLDDKVTASLGRVFNYFLGTPNDVLSAWLDVLGMHPDGPHLAQYQYDFIRLAITPARWHSITPELKARLSPDVVKLFEPAVVSAGERPVSRAYKTRPQRQLPGMVSRSISAEGSYLAATPAASSGYSDAAARKAARDQMTLLEKVWDFFSGRNLERFLSIPSIGLVLAIVAAVLFASGWYREFVDHQKDQMELIEARKELKRLRGDDGPPAKDGTSKEATAGGDGKSKNTTASEKQASEGAKTAATGTSGGANAAGKQSSIETPPIAKRKSEGGDAAADRGSDGADRGKRDREKSVAARSVPDINAAKGKTDGSGDGMGSGRATGPPPLTAAESSHSAANHESTRPTPGPVEPARTVSERLDEVNKLLKQRHWNDAKAILERTLPEIGAASPELRRWNFLSAWYDGRHLTPVDYERLLDLLPVRFGGKPYVAAIAAGDNIVNLLEREEAPGANEQPALKKITSPLGTGSPPSFVTTLDPSGSFAASNEFFINGVDFRASEFEPVTTSDDLARRYSDSKGNGQAYTVTLGHFAYDKDRRVMLVANLAWRSRADSDELFSTAPTEPHTNWLSPSRYFLLACPLGVNVVGMAFFPQLDAYFVAHDDGSLTKVSPGANPRPVNPVWPKTPDLNAHAFDATRSRIAVAVASRVTVYDFSKDPAQLLGLDDRAPVRVLALGRRGDLVATASAGRIVRIFDLTTKALLIEYEVDGSAFRLAFGPDDRYLVAGVADKERTEPGKAGVKDPGSKIYLWPLPGPPAGEGR